MLPTDDVERARIPRTRAPLDPTLALQRLDEPTHGDLRDLEAPRDFARCHRPLLLKEHKQNVRLLRGDLHEPVLHEEARHTPLDEGVDPRQIHGGVPEADAGVSPAPDAAASDPNEGVIDCYGARSLPDLRLPQTPITKGDTLSLSIGAASILAKTERDAFMVSADAQYPHFGFARHKGYGTPEHLAALRTHGPCPLHRRSYAPVREAAGLVPLQGVLGF